MGSLRTGGSLRFQPVRTVDISTLCSQQKEEGTGKQIKTNSLYSEPSASSVSSALRVCFWVTCRSESLLEVGGGEVRFPIGMGVIEADDVFIAGAGQFLYFDQALGGDAVAAPRVGLLVVAGDGQGDRPASVEGGPKKHSAALLGIAVFAFPANEFVVGLVDLQHSGVKSKATAKGAEGAKGAQGEPAKDLHDDFAAGIGWMIFPVSCYF